MTGAEFQNYPALSGTLAANDTLLALQKSDTSASAAGTVHQVPAGNLAITLTPSGDTTGAADAAAISAAISALPSGDGGVVRLAALADWNIECGQVTASTGVYISAAGCWVNARGAGDVFRFVDTSTYSSRDLRGGGILGFPVIDGTHATGNSAAVHAGDILQLRMDVQAQNFTAGTTSKGVWLDNQNYWTEQLKGRIFAQNCTAHVVFDVSGTPATTATGSYDRADVDVYIAQGGTSNDGVVFQNGTYVADGALAVRGNFNGAASNPSTAVLRLTGSAGGSRPDTGKYSGLAGCRLDIGTECNTSGGSTDGPYTLYMGASGNNVSACYGVLDFSADGNYFQASNATASNFGYAGTILGDAVLAAIPQVFARPVTVDGGSAVNPFLVSTDGTATSDGAVYAYFDGSNRVALALYSVNNGVPVYIVPDVNATHLAPAFGGYLTHGYGLLCSTSGSGNTAFVLQNFSQSGSGVGNATFTVFDNNEVVTYHNTLDDGSGNATVAGNLNAAGGIADAEQFVALTTTYTLSSTTALQKLFNATANGALTVAASTSYFFECEFDLTNTTTNAVSFGFGGTATLTSVKYTALSQKGTATTTPAAPSIAEGTAAAAQALVATTAAAGAVTARIRGIVRINATGTLIPEVALGVGTTGVVVGTNSFFRIWPVGSNTVTDVGNWS